VVPHWRARRRMFRGCAKKILQLEQRNQILLAGTYFARTRLVESPCRERNPTAIAELKPPSTVKELRQYLGVASWYRRFVPDFSRIVKPLNDLLRKGSI